MNNSILKHLRSPNSFIRLTVGFLAIGVATVSVGQDAPAPPPAPPGDMMFMHGPGPVEAMHGDIGEGKVVTGAPLTADILVTRENVLADGNRIHHETHTTFYRDSQGRIRREMTVDINTPTTGGVKHTIIMIKDSVSGQRYMLDPANKTARELPMPGSKGKGPRPEAPDGSARRGMAPKDVQETSLGTKTIDGVQAVGTRVTRTIPAGEIGNEKPIEVVTERWVATDLQLPVLMTHSDPMMGTVTTKVTSLTRAEPDAALFQVPTDYKIIRGRSDEPFYVPLKP